MKVKYIFCLFFFLSPVAVLYSSCARGNAGNSKAISEKEEQGIEIRRFDKDLYKALQDSSLMQEDSLRVHYLDFLKAFGSVTINYSETGSADFFPLLKKYFGNEALSQVYRDALSIYNNIEPYEKELAEANILASKYLNGKQLPTLCMHVSGFKANTIVLQNLISISIDKYLGKSYPLYYEFFEEYQRTQMEPEMLVRDYLKAWLMSELTPDNKRKDLLAEMLNQGKILYALQLLLPNREDASLIGYTSAQLDWVKVHEKEIWRITAKKNYLFSNEYMVIVKYMGDAPYTSLISPDSPGRVGAWIGWQIVRRYAENSGQDLEAILKDADSRKILKAAKYTP
jgi:hypothetical protein